MQYVLTHLPWVSPLTTDSNRKLGASMSPSGTRQRYASTGVSWSENTRLMIGYRFAFVFAAAVKAAYSAELLMLQDVAVAEAGALAAAASILETAR